ncbi:two-component system, sensor histidine kinase YesM [Anaerosporobacter mobilis DSM 15930]|uniref:Two-component system, sensor histidine kinase YesM n=1 Tax=Anaerosporobacter mobilis DSM 15930 TaxID=1120996 RepID=A0A1M7LZB3_9FIRM|nr:sensor histidine kinase [Anaerosporobacter mobilis]SHM83188.1 two-component system, sensor histidine kinase YesM [Anaerosporobacter mobilis DSM 15930]
MLSFHVNFKKKITLKIKNQLYTVYLLGILIPVTIVGCYLILNTRSLLIKHHTAQINSDNIRVRSIILDVTTSVKNIADEIFSDNQLQEILSTTYGSKQEANAAIGSYDKFKKYLSRYAEIANITIYTMNDTIQDYTNFKKITPEIQRTEWYKEASNTARYLWHTRTVTDSKGINPANELTFSYRIPITQRGDYALLVMNISNNYLRSRINNNTFKTIITVNKDFIFYGNEKKLTETLALPIDYDQKYFTYSGSAFYNEEEALVELSTLIPIQSQDKLYIVTIDTEALKDTKQIILICVGTLLFSVFVPLLIVIFYANHFSNRINTLRSEMHKVSKGDYNIIHGFTGNDELSEVYSDLTTMITSIKEMDKEIYEGKINQQRLKNHQQKIEFEMLSSQINPHFLYNTLETIRMKALSNQDKDVATAVKLLGKYMRHNLESTGITISLRTELEYIEIYLTIQKLRFGDKINFAISIEPGFSTSNYYILSLLIQPIVENSIIHGLEEIESNGMIHINVSTDSTNDTVIIAVSDNGVGLTEEEHDKLLDKIHSREKRPNSSIGLFNIYQRIQLCYGTEYGLTITSVPDKGTTVSIILPLHYKWEDL